MLGAGATPALLAQIPIAEAPTQDEQAMSALAIDYWDAYLRNHPTYATFAGDNRFNGNLEDLGPKARATELAEIREFRRRIQAIDPAGLKEENKITPIILSQLLDFDEGISSHSFYQWRIDHIDGPQSWMIQILNFTPLKTEEDAMALTARFKAYPYFFEQYMANLNEGLKNRRAAPRIAVERTIKQIEEMLAKTPEDSPFGLKIKTMPKELAAKHHDRAMTAVNQTVWPSLQKFLNFLKNDYLANSRNDDVGIGAINGGQEAYEFLIRYHTTSPHKAQELHQAGLEELNTIHQEMDALAKKLGFKGNVEQFMDKVRSDPKNFFKHREEVTASAKKNLALANAKLPQFFRTLPKTPCEVRVIEDYREKDAPAAFYYQPDQNGKRPGIYYINTYNPASRPRYTMTALAVHEAMPGHHLQIALSLEATNLPLFRRNRDFTAFTEGWGLYAERLAQDMGLYQTDMDHLGMLTYQAWRASRLVIDTGIHAMGWSRDKAIDFLKKNAPLMDEEIVNEVDRYIVWPGQALAYKVGQREILALRAQAQQRLGEKFDLREFHDVVLRNGSIPLPMLRQMVEDWLKSKV